MRFFKIANGSRAFIRRTVVSLVSFVRAFVVARLVLLSALDNYFTVASDCIKFIVWCCSRRYILLYTFGNELFARSCSQQTPYLGYFFILVRFFGRVGRPATRGVQPGNSPPRNFQIYI